MGDFYECAPTKELGAALKRIHRFRLLGRNIPVYWPYSLFQRTLVKCGEENSS